MTTPKETYEYCEQLIDDQLTKAIKEIADVDKRKQELKDLYKHLENIQAMKKSYLSGR